MPKEVVFDLNEGKPALTASMKTFKRELDAGMAVISFFADEAVVVVSCDSPGEAVRMAYDYFTKHPRLRVSDCEIPFAENVKGYCIPEHFVMAGVTEDDMILIFGRSNEDKAKPLN
jgi:hypothetical protein